MGFISRVLYFFTPYTDTQERVVGTFFKGLSEHKNRSQIHTRLGRLLQHNIAVINLWTEYRYKGYRYLSKSERRKLYSDLQLIADDFDHFYRNNTQISTEIAAAYAQETVSGAVVEPEKVVLLYALTQYFSLARGLYEYHDSSSFGRLLRDPSRAKLVGDCNQIVTLYIYLYSRYHDIHDLRVRLLPGHVALHYGGVDVEATNGTFTDYKGVEGNTLLPVEEIVSINLLDTTDSYLSTHEVAAEDLLQASRLAYILSHNRDVVTHNLDAAYGRVINSLMERHNYKKALDYAIASRSTTTLGVVGHNGAAYEIDHHNYAAARRFAQYAPDRDTLIQTSWHAEGDHHYEAHRYYDAIKAFEHVSDQALVRQCYSALFMEEQGKLGSNLTTGSIKEYAGTIKRMRTYAQKSGDKGLIQHVDNLHKYL